MNKRSILYAILIVLIFLGGLSVNTQSVRAISTNTDWVTHGTAWVPQTQASFKVWHPYGWGTMGKAAAAIEPWVHAPLTFGSVLNGVVQKVVYAEFCAQSSNGVSTYPKEMDMWDGNTRILAQTFSWPADNSLHCISHTFTPAWHADLGISVLLHYANTTDSITMYKAWVRTQQ